MTECTICTSKYTSCTRQKLECPKCNESFCKECLKNDINTDKEDNRIKCFFCGEEFTMDFLKGLFPSTFLKKVIMPKREIDNFVQQQMAQLPATQVQKKSVNSEKKFIRATGLLMIVSQFIRVNLQRYLNSNALPSRVLDLYRLQASV